MIDIILCVLAGSALLIVLKLVGRYNLQLWPVITIHYGIAALCSVIMSGRLTDLSAVPSFKWLPLTILLGILFIIIFSFLGLCTEKRGITVTAIAQKMSLVLPISAAFFLYHDKVTPLKIAGILLALGAIFLTTRKSKTAEKITGNPIEIALLPALVFFGSGSTDSLINYIQRTFLVGVPHHDFLTIVFSVACITGMIVIAVSLFRGHPMFTWREVGMGVILGIPDYFGMFFVLRALEFSGLQSSVIYPILNIGVVTVSTFIAWLAFKEKLSRINVIGIALAIVAIVMLSFN